MKSFLISLVVLCSMPTFANPFELHCTGAAIERSEDGPGWAFKKEIFTKTFKLGEHNVYFVTDGKTMKSYSKEELSQVVSIKNKSIYMMGRGFDDNGDSLNEVFLYAGKVIKVSIGADPAVSYNSVFWFTGTMMTNIDLEKGIWFQCEKR